MAAPLSGARDCLSLASNKAACCFVGRLPRRSSLEALSALFQSVGLIPKQLLPSRETYLFVELHDEHSAKAACSMLNGAMLGGQALVVLPALSLTKLFIGNVHRRADAATVHEAISALEPGLLSVELFEEASGAAHIHRGNPVGGASRGGPLGGHLQQHHNQAQHAPLSPHVAHGMAVAAAIASGHVDTMLPQQLIGGAYGGDPASTGGPVSPDGSASSGSASAPGAAGPAFQHRGFCFAEFADHDSAHRALRALIEPSFTRIPAGAMAATAAAGVPGAPGGWGPDGGMGGGGGYGDDGSGAQNGSGGGNGLKVDWAEPLQDVPDEVMRTVRILYVSNLPPAPEDASESLLARMFERHGPVERVKRMKNFAFVHFRARESAEAALGALNNAVLAGHAIKVQWSKPPPRAAAAAALHGLNGGGGGAGGGADAMIDPYAMHAGAGGGYPAALGGHGINPISLNALAYASGGGPHSPPFRGGGISPGGAGAYSPFQQGGSAYGSPYGGGGVMGGGHMSPMAGGPGGFGSPMAGGPGFYPGGGGSGRGRGRRGGRGGGGGMVGGFGGPFPGGAQGMMGGGQYGAPMGWDQQQQQLQQQLQQQQQLLQWDQQPGVGLMGDGLGGYGGMMGQQQQMLLQQQQQGFANQQQPAQQDAAPAPSPSPPPAAINTSGAGASSSPPPVPSPAWHALPSRSELPSAPRLYSLSDSNALAYGSGSLQSSLLGHQNGLGRPSRDACAGGGKHEAALSPASGMTRTTEGATPTLTGTAASSVVMSHAGGGDGTLGGRRDSNATAGSHVTAPSGGGAGTIGSGRAARASFDATNLTPTAASGGGGADGAPVAASGGTGDFTLDLSSFPQRGRAATVAVMRTSPAPTASPSLSTAAPGPAPSPLPPQPATTSDGTGGAGDDGGAGRAGMGLLGGPLLSGAGGLGRGGYGLGIGIESARIGSSDSGLGGVSGGTGGSVPLQPVESLAAPLEKQQQHQPKPSQDAPAATAGRSPAGTLLVTATRVTRIGGGAAANASSSSSSASGSASGSPALAPQQQPQQSGDIGALSARMAGLQLTPQQQQQQQQFLGGQQPYSQPGTAHGGYTGTSPRQGGGGGYPQQQHMMQLGGGGGYLAMGPQVQGGFGMMPHQQQQQQFPRPHSPGRHGQGYRGGRGGHNQQYQQQQYAQRQQFQQQQQLQQQQHFFGGGGAGMGFHDQQTAQAQAALMMGQSSMGMMGMGGSGLFLDPSASAGGGGAAFGGFGDGAAPLQLHLQQQGGGGGGHLLPTSPSPGPAPLASPFTRNSAGLSVPLSMMHSLGLGGSSNALSSIPGGSSGATLLGSGVHSGGYGGGDASTAGASPAGFILTHGGGTGANPPHVSLAGSSSTAGGSGFGAFGAAPVQLSGPVALSGPSGGALGVGIPISLMGMTSQQGQGQRGGSEFNASAAGFFPGGVAQY